MTITPLPFLYHLLPAPPPIWPSWVVVAVPPSCSFACRTHIWSTGNIHSRILCPWNMHGKPEQVFPPFLHHQIIWPACHSCLLILQTRDRQSIEPVWYQDIDSKFYKEKPLSCLSSWVYHDKFQIWGKVEKISREWISVYLPLTITLHWAHFITYISIYSSLYSSTSQAFLFVFAFRATPAACGSSQARGQIGTTAADLHQIPDPPIKARDRTRILMNLRFISAAPQRELQIHLIFDVFKKQIANICICLCEHLSMYIINQGSVYVYIF